MFWTTSLSNAGPGTVIARRLDRGALWLETLLREALEATPRVGSTCCTGVEGGHLTPGSSNHHLYPRTPTPSMRARDLCWSIWRSRPPPAELFFCRTLTPRLLCTGRLAAACIAPTPTQTRGHQPKVLHYICYCTHVALQACLTRQSHPHNAGTSSFQLRPQLGPHQLAGREQQDNTNKQDTPSKPAA